MGSTFSNIQVHTHGRDSSALLEGVVALLYKTLRADGFLPAETEQSCDRSILLAVGPTWIGVYDELCDEPCQDVAERLASELSRQLATHVLTILVYDSDVLDLALFDSGALIDRFNSNPQYFGKASAEERKSLRGRPDHWEAVLAPGTPSTALRAVWRAQKLFAEDTLRGTGALLGLDEGYVGLGFKDLREGDLELPNIQPRRLGFQHAVRPAHETRAEGPPQFVFNSSSVRLVGVVGGGKGFDGCAGSCAVQNRGGSSRGLSVVVSGDALDRGLLSIAAVELVVSLGERQTVLNCPTQSELRGEQCVAAAAFPELDITAGPATAESALELGQSRQDYNRRVMCIHANLLGHGESPGTGALHVAFVPHSAPAGQATISLQAEIFEPARLPLRAAKPARPRAKRPQHVLFALVSLDLEQRDAAAAAIPMIERFLELLEPSNELSLVVFPAEPRARPRTSKARLAGLLRGNRWRKVRTEIERAACVSGERKVPVEDFFARHPSDGFSFGASFIRSEVAGDPKLPTLALWFDLENVAANRASAAQSLFETLMTEAMVRHSGVQAQVARATMMSGGSPETTEYESECGINGQCTLRRSWLSRFLRGVSVGTLWLGESHAKSIPDTEALAAAARVEQVGRSLKITIEHEEALARVEQALAPLLPSVEDWRRVVLNRQ